MVQMWETQYRSAIFCHAPQLEAVAKEMKIESGRIWNAPVVTEITPFKAFYPAEQYHQVTISTILTRTIAG